VSRTRSFRRLLPLLSAVLLALLLQDAVGTASAAGASGRHANRAVCTRPRPGFAHCDAVVRLDGGGHPQLATAPGGLGPADLAGAYSLPAGGGEGRTVAVVDAYDDPHAAADLATYRATFGLPPCTVASGCLSIVAGNGSSQLPAANAGWAEETSLDLDAVSATCPGCRILLVEARSSAITDLLAAERTALAAPGVVAVSNSWGAGEPADADKLGAVFASPSVTVTVSTGDSGYGVEFPASAPAVVAVGGTTLTVGADHRRVAETAWSGAGSGCSAHAGKPGWQRDRSCPQRAVADAAAVADPDTGLAVYDTFGLPSGGGWLVVGGTSLAAPVIAGVHALGGATGSTAAGLYGAAAAVHDVTRGSNGHCANRVLCTAGPGWDGPTGVGSPDGTAGW